MWLMTFTYTYETSCVHEHKAHDMALLQCSIVGVVDGQQNTLYMTLVDHSN